MVTDQNRASQRILYEQYMAVLATRNAHTQKVLFPEVVQFPPSYVPSIGAILDNLRILGFEITDLGSGLFKFFPNALADTAGTSGNDHDFILKHE